MLFLLASPLFLACLAAYFGCTAALLRYFGKLSFRRLLVVNLLVAAVVAILFARQGYVAFGPQDAAVAFGLFGLFSFAALALGSTAWWKLRSRAAGECP